MSEQLVRVDSPRDGVAHIILNRPDKRNALNMPLLAQLIEVVEEERERRRVIVLRGEGQVFCAGLDLKEATDESKSHESAGLVAHVLKAIYEARCVTIAAVHGAAVAGGAGLMTVCDAIVAGEGTVIGYPEVRRGLVAGLVMTFLKRRLHERDAREFLLFGETIDARHAYDIGLVNRVAPHDDVLKVADELVGHVLKGAPGAIKRTKDMFDALSPRSVEEDIQLALDYHKEARTSADAREGMSAFLEKRKPHWDPEA